MSRPIHISRNLLLFRQRRNRFSEFGAEALNRWFAEMNNRPNWQTDEDLHRECYEECRRQCPQFLRDNGLVEPTVAGAMNLFNTRTKRDEWEEA